MAMLSAVPSDLFPFVFSFLRENKLLSVAREFTKATGVKDQDPNAASLLDIFNDWLQGASPMPFQSFSSSGAKKRKLRSNGTSVTKKKKRDSSRSYDYSNEDDEPKVKQPALQLSEAKKTALDKPEASPTKAESSSSDESDSEKDMKRKPSTKSFSVQLKPTVAKHLQQKKPQKSNLVSEFNSSSPSEGPKNHWHPPISKYTTKQGVNSPPNTQKASNGKVKESSSSSNSSDDEDSSPEKISPAKKMQLLNSAVVKPAAFTPKSPCTKRLLTKVKESADSDDSSDNSEDEKATIKSKPKSGKASLTKLLAEENNALKKAESSSDDSSSEEYEIKSKSSSKFLHAKAMVKPVPRKPTRPKDVCSSSDEDTESNSSEDETPVKTRTKASASKYLVAKAKSCLASTKSVNKSLDSNTSLSELEVKKKGTSGKKKQKEPLPCPKQLFLSEKKILAAPTNISSDLDASIAYKDDTCNPTVKHKAVAYGEPPASIAGMYLTVPTKSVLPKKGPAGSSSTSDSSGEEEQKPKKSVPAERVKLNSSKKAKSSCSDSSSDLESKRGKKSLLFTSSKRTAAVSSKKKTTKKHNHSKSSSHSEEENSVVETGSASTHRTATLKTKTTEKNKESSEESSSSEEQVNGKNVKKRKMEVTSGNQNGKERTSDRKALAQTPNTFLKVKTKKSQSAEPFRRVRDEEIEVDFRVGNNSFDAKQGAKGDWGEKANNVLKFTKGKSFRHEKTKKKRGNYCGGEISTSIKSIKFDSE